MASEGLSSAPEFYSFKTVLLTGGTGGLGGCLLNTYRSAVTDSKLAVDTTCHFLRVPAEIRLNIYRCLLLDPPRASLDPSYPEKAFDATTDRIQQRSTLDALLDQYLEENDLIESYDPEGQGSVMYNHLAPNQSNPHWETPSSPAIDEEESFQSAGVSQD
ncbi:hypothetical protein HO133_006080 [Letharia lupina]|uniref:Uncharacterized protein n=1 Tax=Letharia lupina TaxID=560253 RepID=A0A8H6F7H3_9LECA|nr:uncharacterized protein HO133_006080 [Letharia lupina]KAF6218122.1 hypothetical protein HO133_006080 [Letharia lupina]